MKVQISVVGQHREDTVEWPEGWPLPRLGEEVCTEEGHWAIVRNICYYPHGEEGENLEPFVYVVVGPARV